MFGVSDHDLMFDREAIDIPSDDEDDVTASAHETPHAFATPALPGSAAHARKFKEDERAFIERRVAEAKRLIRAESAENSQVRDGVRPEDFRERGGSTTTRAPPVFRVPPAKQFQVCTESEVVQSCLFTSTLE